MPRYYQAALLHEDGSALVLDERGVKERIGVRLRDDERWVGAAIGTVFAVLLRNDGMAFFVAPQLCRREAE
eukprot:5773153-Amphidinium_carterae.1